MNVGVLDKMTSQVIAGINQQYGAGTIEYIATKNPALYREVSNAESKVNEVYWQVVNGQADQESYKESLKAWYVLEKECIRQMTN